VQCTSASGDNSVILEKSFTKEGPVVSLKLIPNLKFAMTNIETLNFSPFPDLFSQW